MSPGGLDSVTTDAEGLGAALLVAPVLAAVLAAVLDGEPAPADVVTIGDVVGRSVAPPVTLVRVGTASEGGDDGELQALTASMMATSDAGTVTREGRMSHNLETPRPAEGERKVNVRLPRRRVSLRRRVTAAILVVTSAAVLVFAAPLAYAVRQLYRNEELTSLQRDAVRLASIVPDAPQDAAQLPQRPVGLPEDVTFGVYHANGHRLAGQGPDVSSVAAFAADGRTHGAIDAGFTASAPVPSDGVVSVTVLTMSSGAAVSARTWRAWSVMATFALAILLAAGALAKLLARRLAQPLEDLTAAVRRLGDGDFTVRPHRSAILEADDAAAALTRTAVRLGQVRERERSFTRDASHQLRTPLAGLLLGLENALERDAATHRTALQLALDRGRAMEAIIDDLLQLTRPASATSADLSDVLRELEDRWHGVLAEGGRRLVVRPMDNPTRIAIPAPALRQICDILVDNAHAHGTGTVTVSVEEIADGISLTVSDEGAAMTVRSVSTVVGGLGLPLAASLAAGAGAVLHVPVYGSPPVFRLLVPTLDPGQMTAS